jgi:hypothetical protein
MLSVDDDSNVTDWSFENAQPDRAHPIPSETVQQVQIFSSILPEFPAVPTHDPVASQAPTTATNTTTTLQPVASSAILATTSNFRRNRSEMTTEKKKFVSTMR